MKFQSRRNPKRSLRAQLGALMWPPKEGHTEPAQEDPTEARVKRCWDESCCRTHLGEVKWIDAIPNSAGLEKEKQYLKTACQHYVTTFCWDHMEKFKMQFFNCRLITVELMRALAFLNSNAWLPRNVTNPHDRYIRTAADANCSPEFQDPGNVTWDWIWHLLRLDKYLTVTAADKVLKTPATEYGSGRNRSAIGVVNLRGNILEAILHDLQTMARTPIPRWGHGASRKGAAWSSSWSSWSQSSWR